MNGSLGAAWQKESYSLWKEVQREGYVGKKGVKGGISGFTLRSQSEPALKVELHKRAASMMRIVQ